MKVPRISDAEWEVMRVVWEHGSATATEIVDLIPDRDWSERTVKSLISRLVKKGALGFTAEGKRYRYSALVTQEDSVRDASRSFVERVFGGAVRPALLTFVRDSDLSDEEIAELERLLGTEEEA